MDDDALKLFGDIVSANVSQASALSNAIIDDEKQQKLNMARGFLRLWDAVNESAEIVTTRNLEMGLHGLMIYFDMAMDIVEGEEIHD
jgi:hypothetical protein